jgi:hypothetical protein
MFNIILNGLALDLNPGQQITLEAESNLFTDTLKADGSELISLAPTPRNLKALGHADVIEIEPLSETYPCLLTIGLNTYPATLRIQEVTPTSINAYVLYNMAALSCFSKNCKEFDWSVPTDTLPNQFHQGCTQLWPATPFYFPALLNPAFYDDVDTDPGNKINPNFEDVINQAEIVSGDYLPIFNYIDGSNYINRNTLVPMVPVLEIFTRALAHDGYTLQGTWPNTAVMARLFQYNNLSLDKFGDTLEANAANLLGYSAAFAGDKLNFITTDNGTLFNLANDTYEITEQGNFAFQIKITLPLGQVLPGPILKLFEDGIEVDETFFSGADFVGGQYIFTFQRSYTAPQIGTVVDFRLAMQGTPQNVNVSNLQLNARKLIGVSLIQFSPITNLSGHVPDVSFADYFNAWLTAFQLSPSVDVEKKIFYLNYRKAATQLTVVKNLEGAALQPILQEWQETKGYKLFWGKPDVEQITDLTIKQGLYLNTTGTATVQDALPEGNEGASIQPPFQLMQHTLLNLPDYHPDALTLFIVERGQSQPFKLTEPPKAMRIGLIATINSDVVATNTLPELNLLWRDNAQSIGGYVLPWLQFLQRSKRLFKLDVNPHHPLAHTLNPGEAVKLLHNTFLIQKLTRTYTATGLQKISLELRKV